MKDKNNSNKPKNSKNKNGKALKNYYAQFFVGIISGFTVLLFGNALSYIDKRDWLSFSIRLLLSIIFLVLISRLGFKVYQKIVKGYNT